MYLTIGTSFLPIASTSITYYVVYHDYYSGCHVRHGERVLRRIYPRSIYMRSMLYMHTRICTCTCTCTYIGAYISPEIEVHGQNTQLLCSSAGLNQARVGFNILHGETLFQVVIFLLFLLFTHMMYLYIKCSLNTCR